MAIHLVMDAYDSMYADPLAGLGVFLEVERPPVFLAHTTRPDAWIPINALY